MEKVIWMLCNSPSGHEYESLVCGLEIFNAQASFFFWCAYIFPSPETKRFGTCFFSNTSPPKCPDNGDELCNKLFGEKNIGHVINWDRGKDRFDKSESCSMGKLVSLVGV
jgi:hypothetical protein